VLLLSSVHNSWCILTARSSDSINNSSRDFQPGRTKLVAFLAFCQVFAQHAIKTFVSSVGRWSPRCKIGNQMSVPRERRTKPEIHYQYEILLACHLVVTMDEVARLAGNMLFVSTWLYEVHSD
jgi:hypothetical protein